MSRAPVLLGMIAEADSKSYFFFPFILSFSLPKGDRGLSFMERSNMLAVRLLRVNWMVTWIAPRSFSFFPALECSLCHLEFERRGEKSLLFPRPMTEPEGAQRERPKTRDSRKTEPIRSAQRLGELAEILHRGEHLVIKTVQTGCFQIMRFAAS